MLSSVLAVVVGLGKTLCAKAQVVQRLTAYSRCGMSRRLSRGVPAERAPITPGLIDAAIAANTRTVKRAVKLVSGSVRLATMDEHTPNTGLVPSSTRRASSGRSTSSRRRLGLAPVMCATPPSSTSWKGSEDRSPSPGGEPAVTRSGRELQLADGNVGRDQRATVGWAVDPEASVEYAEPVGEPEQAVSVGAGASDAIVAHLHP
jgi:hypothetical protein